MIEISKQVPVIKHRVLYAEIILIFLMLRVYSDFIQLIGCSALLLFTLTIGYDDFKWLYHKRGSLFTQTLTVYASSLFISFLIFPFAKGMSEQVYELYRVSFSWSFVSNRLSAYALKSIGEEIFKICLLYLIYSLIIRRKSHRVALIQSAMMVSLLYSLIYIPYSPHNWMSILLMMGSGTLLNFYFLVKYQSLIPLILAHLMHYIIVMFNYVDGSQLQQDIALIIGGWFIIKYFLNRLKNHSFPRSRTHYKKEIHC